MANTVQGNASETERTAGAASNKPCRVGWLPGPVGWGL